MGCEISSVERLAGGGNNRVYRGVATGSGIAVAIKVYFRDPADPRDRLGTEYGASGLMWRHGIGCIPRPLAADPEAGVAVYDFVAGEPPVKSGITEGDVDAVLSFLEDLNALAKEAGSEWTGPASEACFSLREIESSINARLMRLSGGSRDPLLLSFLELEFKPCLAVALRRASALALPAGRSIGPRMWESGWTLSPSDYGFHNAVRRPDGTLVFLDFEYFGWDDPAKMLSDFLFHPAITLNAGLRRRFVRRALANLARDEATERRWRAVNPLWGLKWCLILLNIFTPEHLKRRQFAASDPAEVERRKSDQVAKARALINDLRAKMESRTIEGFVA